MYELTKEQRLCKNREYQLVYRRGKSYVNRRVVLYVLPRSPKQPTRIGFVTGKKIGCAVERNRCGYKEAEQSILQLFRHARVLKKK